ncbi:hypothetical protein [Streptomyces fructofermentans]|uniref:Uncharacterized protein n=1 Tax=Streptomyces fructofermentans TaxID=152141 RepID=A0A918N972_9ACTN|nr:hypothetical protein [Streptomyces fructofermentans]GGX50225.1 hypothetical protein GCM10010515_16950 [Streptomyces fructofermentans]
MSGTLTFDEVAVPLRALRLLAVDFGHLPAPSVHVSTIYPERLELSFYDGLSGFELWREALAVAPDAVTYREQNDGRTGTLSASVDHAGATVLLIAYTDVVTPVLVGGAA